MSIAEMVNKSGLPYKTIYKRVFTLKWDIDIALSTPKTTPRAYKKLLKKSAPIKRAETN